MFFNIEQSIKIYYRNIDFKLKFISIFEDSILWIPDEIILNSIQSLHLNENLFSILEIPNPNYIPAATIDETKITRVVFSVDFYTDMFLNIDVFDNHGTLVAEFDNEKNNFRKKWKRNKNMINYLADSHKNIWLFKMLKISKLETNPKSFNRYIHWEIIDFISNEFLAYFKSDRVLFFVSDCILDERTLDFYIIHEYTNSRYKTTKLLYPEIFTLEYDDGMTIPKNFDKNTLIDVDTFLNECDITIDNSDSEVSDKNLIKLPNLSIELKNYEFINDALSTTYGSETNSSDPTQSWRSDADGKKHKFDVPHPDDPNYEDKPVVINPESGLPDPKCLKDRLMERYNKLIELGELIKFDPKTIPEWESVSDYIPEDIYPFVSEETKQRYKKILEGFYTESLNEASKALLFFRWNLTPEQMEQALLGDSIDLESYSCDRRPKLGTTILNISESNLTEFIPKENYNEKFDNYYFVSATPEPLYMSEVKKQDVVYDYDDNFHLPGFSLEPKQTTELSCEVINNSSALEEYKELPEDDDYLYIILPKNSHLSDASFEYVGPDEFGDSVYRKYNEQRRYDRDKMRTHWNVVSKFSSFDNRILYEKKNRSVLEALYNRELSWYPNICFSNNSNLSIDNSLDLIDYNIILEQQNIILPSIFNGDLNTNVDDALRIFGDFGWTIKIVDSPNTCGFYHKSMWPSYVYRTITRFPKKLDLWFGSLLIFRPKIWGFGANSLLEIMYKGFAKKWTTKQNLIIRNLFTDIELLFINIDSFWKKYTYNKLYGAFFKNIYEITDISKIKLNNDKKDNFIFKKNIFDISEKNINLEKIQPMYMEEDDNAGFLTANEIHEGLLENPSWTKEQVVLFYKPYLFNVECSTNVSEFDTSELEGDWKINLSNFIDFIKNYKNLNNKKILNILKTEKNIENLLLNKLNIDLKDFEDLQINKEQLYSNLYSLFYTLLSEYKKTNKFKIK